MSDLQIQLDSLDGVPEALTPFFKEGEDGKYELSGLAPKAKVDEFRETTRKLWDEKKGWEKRQQELEAQAKEAADKLRKIEEEREAKAAGKSPDELQEILQKRTEQMRKDHEAALAALEKRYKEAAEEGQTYRSKLTESEIKNGIAVAAQKVGLFPQAVSDAQNEASKIWQPDPETGEVVPRDAQGNIIYGRDAKTPISQEEWLESLKAKEKPHWFQAPGGGGGAKRNNGNSSGPSMARAQFEQLSPEARMEFVRTQRGTVT